MLGALCWSNDWSLVWRATALKTVLSKVGNGEQTRKFGKSNTGMCH